MYLKVVEVFNMFTDGRTLGCRMIPGY